MKLLPQGNYICLKERVCIRMKLKCTMGQPWAVCMGFHSSAQINVVWKLILRQTLTYCKVVFSLTCMRTPRHIPSLLSPSSVSKKHGKLITFLRSFMKSRPTKQKLKQRGILRERVFGCDLGEHLLNSGHDGEHHAKEQLYFLGPSFFFLLTL